MALENQPYPQDVRVRNEAEELAAAGHGVVVLAPRRTGQPRRETVAGVKVKRFRLPMAAGVAGLLVEYLIATARLTAGVVLELARGADVVHLHNPPELLFPVGWLARACGRAVVFDHHDLAPELFEQKFGGGFGAAALRWCERMTMRVAHVVIAANESHRRVAITRGGVDPERVVVVRNAPKAQTLAATPTTREGRLREPRLCYVGSLGSQDGVTVLPELLARLGRAGLEPTLRILGDGPERPAIERLADEHGVRERIELAGHVPHELVPRAIEEADICLDVAPCTPLNHQSTMIKIGEYLAAGRPTVSFALAETRHTAGESVLYAPCGDLDALARSIVGLCEDESLRARLSEQALQRAAQITWERSAERLSAAYALASELTRRRGAAVAG